MARLDAVAVRPLEARAEQQYESAYPPQAVERSCAEAALGRPARRVALVLLRAVPQASAAAAAQPRASPR
jgi:hypothetical protein